MKHIIARTCLVSLLLFAALLVPTGCMDLFDEDEIPTAWTEGGITIDVEYFVEMNLFTYEKSGEQNNIVTFTATADYPSYTWWISNKDDSVGNEKSYVWNTGAEADGQYYVTLVVTESDGATKSATIVVNVYKN